MAHIYERVVQLISNDPAKRDDRDIESLIPWFQNMSGLFKSQKTDVVKDIVRNCEFRSVPADNVILKQGDMGACFYIILSGAVSIYINQTLEEQGNVQNPNDLAKAMRKAKAKSRGRSHSLKITAAGPGRSKTLANKNSVSFSPSSSHQQRPKHEHGGSTAGISSVARGGRDVGHFPSRLSTTSKNQETSRSPVRQSRSRSLVTTTYSAQEASFFQNREGEGGEELPDSSCSSSDEEMQTTSTGKLDRTVFGVHIRELGPGKSFGELALVQTNIVRSASVIADQPTGLIVVDRDLYNRSLKAAQQQEFAGKKNFINRFPLFRHWTPRQKNVMAMSLTRVQYQFGNSLVRQGDKVRGLIFITSGRALVSIDPIQHIEQYPYMCSQEDVAFAKEVRIGKRSRTSFPGSSDYWPSELRRPGPNTARRRDGYAAAEKEVNMRSFQLCAVGPNDYIGDISVLLHLPTYVSTATCLEPLEALELDLNNFERQVFKKSHSTYIAMREIAALRLGARVHRIQDEQVYSPVFETMLAKFEDMNTSPAMKATLRRKQAEDEDVMVSLFTPSWHSYREKQRLFLRRRQREKQLQEMQMQQMAHAASLGMQLRLQNLNLLSELQQAQDPDFNSLLSRRDSLPASLRDNSIQPEFWQPKGSQFGRQRSTSNRYDRYYLPSHSNRDTQRPPQASPGRSMSLNGHEAGGGGGGKSGTGDGNSHLSRVTGTKSGHLKTWNGQTRQDSRENDEHSHQKKDQTAEAQHRPRPQQAERFPLGIETLF